MADPLGEGAREQLKDEVLYGANGKREKSYEIRSNPQAKGTMWRIILWNQLVYIFERDYNIKRVGPHPPNYFAQSDYFIAPVLLKDKVVAFLLRSDVWHGEDDDYRTWRKWEQYYNRQLDDKNLASVRRQLRIYQQRIVPGTIIPHMLNMIYQTLRETKLAFIDTCYKLYEIIRRENSELVKKIKKRTVPGEKADDAEIALRRAWRLRLKKEEYDINQKTRADKEAKQDAAAGLTYWDSSDEDDDAGASGPSQFKQFIR